LIPEVSAFAARPRSNAEVEAWLDERLGPTPKPGVWWALRQYGPFVHAPTGGPWSFGPRPAYVAAPDAEVRAPEEASPALRLLVRRYLEGFGPASIADIAQFGLVSRSLVRDALAGLGGDLTTFEGPDGTTLHDVPDAPFPPEDVPVPPRLLAMWDSILLAYADRSRVVPPAYRRAIARSNGDTLPSVLVDGHVAGVWRPLDDGIEVTAFERLPDEAWAGLQNEARALVAFLGPRDPAVYRRYARWWGSLPAAEVRIVGRAG
ncbi:MAG TPA: crosslink repair DNA glycosylase YcaQ family protein, partial [Candidatus Limnocylindrales bacterium]|nr:crosslink repair DNA glycosylase YcaQ family protein [Candidatus Limnocylindrales bacterium]